MHSLLIHSIFLLLATSTSHIGVTFNTISAAQHFTKQQSFANASSPIFQQSLIRGIIKSQHQVVLSSQIGGQIIQLPLGIGKAFKQGDLLMRLDCRHYQAEYQATKAKYRAKLKHYQNSQSLLQHNAIGQLEVALAKAELDIAKTSITKANISVEGCNIKAPFSGKVARLLAQPYQSIKAGDAIIEVIDHKHLSVELIIPDSFYFKVKSTTHLIFQIDDSPHQILISITQVSPTIDPVSQTYRAFAQIHQHNNKQLVVGMSGTALVK
ncbi:efflux RND transporter periplasmic adaptor subunit [Endozoicomonas sp. SM1973]|uniref:Efflux RND transporter periplasmic adaptor subunit n=1 Tax=Spartinivicinus marinus TaxID=2994442 RepID=A0A853I6Z4_9GAMM|nr:efflux RND transporter periplasmic adaptor subunit [Spartinivicinus marinus]MCX4028435.1 efflux RND transporter periplasmic adaptor subunit [Spartinivicinus marinus]NYZ67452.1 efflux RND transporter periplasmic adaptor subunit [Spartinivicinus marinus]